MYPSERYPKFGSFVADFAEGLRSQGCEVTLAVQRNPRTGIAVNALKYVGLSLRGLLKGLRGGFDVVHAHYLFPTGAIALVPARLRRRPLVLFAHGSDVLFSAGPWPVRSLARRAVLSADCVVAPSLALKADIVSRFGAEPQRVEVIPSGIDLEVFCPGERSEARQAVGLGGEAPVLLFVGALNDNKGEGCEDILGAMTQPGLEDVALVIVGEGLRRARLEGMAAELGLGERVSFRPFAERARLAEYYRAADAVVVPSRRESLGLVSLEAQACGVPVVATRVGGLVEHLEPGVSGEFYEPGDVPGLAEALLKVLRDAERYDPACRRSQYAAEVAAEKLSALNRRLMAKGGGD
ncbi:MAG: glycosyltransferase [Coriobacteriia bacterium]